MSDELHLTLERLLRARGATMGTMLGCPLPLRFDGIETEWRAVRERCGVVPAGFRALIAATGGDRVAFLQGMLANDVAALTAGQGAYAAYLNQQGKVVADLRVYLQPERLLMDVLAAHAGALTAALERFLVADDVELARVEDRPPLVALMGPASPTTLERVLATSLPTWKALEHHETGYRGESLLVIAVSEIDGQGYLLCARSELAAPLFEDLCAAGAAPVGAEALNVLRVESAVPWYGVDMDEEVLVMEVGLDRAVSFSKGCYLGQEVVERIAARGHVNRRLAGLLVEGTDVPEAGALLRTDGRDAGRLTSAVWSPALGRVIALAYVHRSCLDPGTAVVVQAGDRAAAATVTTLPFVAS